MAKKKTARKPVKKAETPRDGLTLKQRRFIDAYLGEANGNATEAARIAGYAQPSEQGYQNIRKLQIRSAIDARLAESAMPAQEVLSRLSSMARGTMADFLTLGLDGAYRVDLDKARLAGKLHLVKAVRPTKNGLGVELHDSQAALDKLMRYHGMFDKDKSEARDSAVDSMRDMEEAGKRNARDFGDPDATTESGEGTSGVQEEPGEIQ